MSLTSGRYARGSTADYDEWARITGDASWSLDGLMPYFRMSTMLEPVPASVPSRDRKYISSDAQYHSTSRLIHTSYNDSFVPIAADVLKAAEDATGLHGVAVDNWSGNHVGFGNHMGAIARSGSNRGKRSYSACAYFEPVKDRPNLKVACECLASRIVLEGNHKNRATAVQFRSSGQEYTVKAKKEMILCCGTVQSPQILELSGVGDQNVLQKADIECRVPLPGVGANLQDHIMTFIDYEMSDGVQTGDALLAPENFAAAQTLYGETQGGPLTAISTSVGFFPYTLFMTAEERLSRGSSMEWCASSRIRTERTCNSRLYRLLSTSWAALKINQSSVCRSSRARITACAFRSTCNTSQVEALCMLRVLVSISNLSLT
jgi:choline dehydrogenase-like flavoprotein